MQVHDLVNILVIVLLLLLSSLGKRRKKKQQEEALIKKEKPYQPVKAKAPPGSFPEKKTPQQQKVKQKEEEVKVEYLSSRYSDDHAYDIVQTKTISKGRKLLRDKTSLRKGIILSEIFKRPYD